MDGKTGDLDMGHDLDTGQAPGSMGDMGAPASHGDGVQPIVTAATNLGDVEPGRGLTAPSRVTGPNPLVFVLVLTGVVMVFAIIVAMWMYWIVPTLPV